jgi:hypothetical protein
MKRSRDDVLFLVAVFLWIAVIVASWPRAVSFVDEVGYVGRAKLLLGGHLHYLPGSLGVWMNTPHGVVGKFPLLPSLLLAPLVAIAPRAAFALAVAAAVLLTVTARAALKSWGRSPLWALAILAHPSVVILARTAMADVPQAAAAVAAWWACKRGRAGATIIWLTLLVALKETGKVLAFAIVAGEAASSWSALRARDPAALRRVGLGVVGAALGFALSLAGTRIANGSFASGYEALHEHIRPFALSYALDRVPTHLVTLLLVPPLLVAGAWTFWRRRDLGPLFVAGGTLALMCVYFFADTGASRLETLVLAPRMILPVVAFLLIGYGAAFDGLVRRLGRAAAGDAPAPLPVWAAGGLLAATLASVGGVSLVHWRAQRDMGLVGEVASAVADAHGERTLGVTKGAIKVGVLHDGPTTLFDPGRSRPAAVLCSEVAASHRAGGPRSSCALPGYHPIDARGGFVALARDDAGGDAL